MNNWLPQSAAARRWLALTPTYVMVGVFMLVPVGIMAVFSFLEPNPYGGVLPEPSFAAYVKLFFEYDLEDKMVFNPGYLNIIFRSFQLSIMATVVCLVFGYPVAYYITLQPENKRNFYIYLITIPF